MSKESFPFWGASTKLKEFGDLSLVSQEVSSVGGIARLLNNSNAHLRLPCMANSMMRQRGPPGSVQAARRRITFGWFTFTKGNMYETATKIHAEACFSHHHTSMMAATFFRRVYSVIKKYVKKNAKNIYKIIEKIMTACYLRQVYLVIKKYVEKYIKSLTKS